MSGIYPMAVITLALSAAVYGVLIYTISGRTTRYLWLILPGLPLSTFINLAVKKPLALAVGQYAGLKPVIAPQNPFWFLAFLTLLAPLTEEAIKVAPLALRRMRKEAHDSASALWTGFSLGVGFGLGEAAYLAYVIAQSPVYEGIPWYHFTGYLNERILATFGHGVMTCVAVMGLQVGRAAVGYLAAVVLHTLLNAGAVLLRLGLVTEWGTSVMTIGATLLLALIFEWVRRCVSRSGSGEDAGCEVIHYERGG